MTAQELIDVIVMHYNGAPDSETVSIGHHVATAWSAPLVHFSAQISVTVGDLRAMATPRALSMAHDLVVMKQKQAAPAA